MTAPLASLIVYAVVLLVPRGLAALVPAPAARAEDWPGVRYFGGFALLALWLYAGALAGLPLHRVAWAAVVLAGLGLVAAALRPGAAESGLAAGHPLPVLALAIAAAAVSANGIDYVSYTWDEWSNWLGWSRQMIVADRLLTPEMVISTRGELPGWALLISFPGLLQGVWREGDALPVIIAMHLGCLATVWDVVRWVLARRLGLAGAMAAALAWLTLLALLAAEVTWRLVPTSLLIDEPQVYALGGVVALALAGTWPGLDRVRLALAAGLLAGLAYILKHAFVVFLPAYGLLALVLVLAERRDAGAGLPGARAGAGRLLAILAALLVPVLLVRAGWALFGVGGRCFADQLLILHTLIEGRPVYGEAPLALAGRILAAGAGYLATWKLPLSLVAAAGLAAGLGSRRYRLVAAALAVYLATYLAGYFATTLAPACFTEYEVAHLESLTRYLRVPLRVLHLGGCVFGLLVAADALLAVPVVRRRAGHRLALAGVLLLALPLAGWQGLQARRALIETARRVAQPAAGTTHIARTAADARALAGLMAERGLTDGFVQLIVQGGPGDEKPLVQYAGLGERRGDPVRRLLVRMFVHSWAPASREFLTRTSDADGVRQTLLESPVVFPIVVDDWIADAVRPLLVTPGCADQLARRFLFRTADGTGFTCVAKPKEF